MKRTLIYLILASMLLHCSARLGLVSYVYENRHTIAFQLGFIEDVPIAICSSNYEFDKGLHIQVADEGDKSLPVSLPHAREINLFIESNTISPDITFSLLAINQLPDVIVRAYTPPDRLIFHPPAII